MNRMLSFTEELIKGHFYWRSEWRVKWSVREIGKRCILERLWSSFSAASGKIRARFDQGHTGPAFRWIVQVVRRLDEEAQQWDRARW